MKLSPEEARRRLESGRNLAYLSLPGSSPVVQANPSKVEHRTKVNSHRKGSPNIPEEMRDIMIGLKVAGATGAQMGEAFGISRQSAYTAGSGKSGSQPPNAERRAKVEAAQSRIKDVALLKLMKSLDLVTDDKLEDLGAKDLAVFASNMGKVVNSVTEAQENKAPVNIVVYAPEMREEGKFKVIDV